MSRIDGLTEVMELLRRQISAAKSGRKVKTRAAAHRPPLTKTSPQALKQRIQERLRGLDLSGQGERHAARIFLESVLTWEFGEELASDPNFGEMVTEMDQLIQSNEELRAAFTHMIQRLSTNQ